MLSSVLAAATATFLAGLLAVVSFKLLRGDIRTRGLLADKETRDFSPSRLQLLVATVAGAVFYAVQVLAARDSLPPVPDLLLLIVGVSNGTYLGAKIYSRFIRPNSGP